MRNRLTVDDLQKPLSFDSISPVWAERLERQQQPIPLSFKWLRWCLEMISFSKCVVGEAHGFSHYTFLFETARIQANVRQTLE